LLLSRGRFAPEKEAFKEMSTMKREQVNELLLQSLEHEKGGVKVYTAAVACAKNADLKEEWEKYLGETKEHVSKLESLCKTLGIDTSKETPGQKVVRTVGTALVTAMETARAGGDPAAAEIVAAECVVLAETKDHLDWELIAKCGEHLSGKEAQAVKEVAEDVEDEEDEHLYHSRGWCRELWLQSLGLKAVLPPPEERKKVKTAIGAARAEQAAHKHG
jgi:rubrerythrin